MVQRYKIFGSYYSCVEVVRALLMRCHGHHGENLNQRWDTDMGEGAIKFIDQIGEAEGLRLDLEMQ